MLTPGAFAERMMATPVTAILRTLAPYVTRSGASVMRPDEMLR
jgi:hypothetical protein